MANQSTWMTRSAGVLMPVSSLPSKYGIGTFGKAAREWIDFLCAAHQRFWQVLPLGPTSFGNSPYQSYSAFAGEPLYIDLELLCQDGLLKEKRCKRANWGSNPEKADYEALRNERAQVLQKAFENFKKPKALSRFRKKNAAWVEDYALFMALKNLHNGRPWYEWEEDIKLRRPAALKEWTKKCEKEIDYHVFTQYLFFEQWKDIKKYAHKKGILIIGDAPIYVSGDSSDVWAHPWLFQLDEDNNPTEVAGCPPDAFSADGQLWGNPLYRWDDMEKDGFAWWVERLQANLTMFDVLRIDHFRGLESYYAIPYGDKTARNGRWRKGPGMKFVDAINKAMPGAAIIAEDLGYLTPAVRRLLKRSGFPGMKVLQFAFDSREESDYMPHNYQNHCVVYTGTHDNDSTRSWFTSAPPADVAVALEYMGLKDDTDGTWSFIRMALNSVADLAVIPMPDYLDLGAKARINTPSTVNSENWSWRMKPGACTKELAQKMARMADLSGRARDLPKAPEKKAKAKKKNKKGEGKDADTQ